MTPESFGDEAIDISLPLTSTLMVWPGNPSVALKPLKRLSRGDDADVTELRMSTHAGTHLDPPGHSIHSGAMSDSIDLAALIGNAIVLDLTDVEFEITSGELEHRVPAGTRRLLLKTANSRIWASGPSRFPSSYVAVAPDAADWLVDHQIMLVGIDFLSIEAANAPGRPVHTRLGRGGVAVLEGISLFEVPPGAYTLVCLPLSLSGADGCPARAILFRQH